LRGWGVIHNDCKCIRYCSAATSAYEGAIVIHARRTTTVKAQNFMSAAILEPLRQLDNGFATLRNTHVQITTIGAIAKHRYGACICTPVSHIAIEFLT
jgi:hypothetical protein